MASQVEIATPIGQERWKGDADLALRRVRLHQDRRLSTRGGDAKDGITFDRGEQDVAVAAPRSGESNLIWYLADGHRRARGQIQPLQGVAHDQRDRSSIR